MKIAYVTAGAAGMYCGTCLHDNTLAAAMQQGGHDVTLIPTYTPIRTDEDDVSVGRVFYGAINVYLEQKSALFRHTPWVVDRLLNSPGLLNWAARRGTSTTDARQLGEITLSVLQGEDGRQRKELERLVDWLAETIRPDVVHLTNSMFLGLARRLRQALGVPVLCALQGEDIFFEELTEPYHSEVREAMRLRAPDADAFTAPSRYYRDYMGEFLGVPTERIHLIPLGLKLDGHGEREPLTVERPFTIGYLARICPEKGLHLLADGFNLLAGQVGRDQVRLRIAGYLGPRDEAYMAGIRQQISAWGLDDVVDYVGEVDREQKIDFLCGLHVLSVPTTYHEPKGLFALEALANGVPLVLPHHGAFPELIEATGGGLLTEPGSTDDLARGLRELMEAGERRLAMGRAGKEFVHRECGDRQMADRTLKLYRSYVENRMER
jgi:glycosyltransferase involved in cell wall biosynthesis